MTNPIASGVTAPRAQVSPQGVVAQEIGARRADEISRKLRRAEEVRSMATDKTSTVDSRGLTQTGADLSRGAALLHVADQGLEAVSTALRRIQVLVSRASDKSVSDDERAKLQVELDAARREIARVVQQTQANGVRPLDGSLGAVTYQTSSSGSTVVVPALPNLSVSESATVTTSLSTSAAGAAQTAATAFDYATPTVPGVVANNVQITATNVAVAQTVTVRGQLFDLGTFAPDAKTLAAAINAIQGENGILEAHADPNVLVGISTEYNGGGRGKGDRGEGGGHDGGDDSSWWPPAWGRRRLESSGNWPGVGPWGARRSEHSHHGHGPHGHHHGGGRGRVDPSGSFTINGTVIQVTADDRATDAERRAAAISAINAASSQTGVVATDNGRGVTLTAADGRNMTVLFQTDVRNVTASTFGVATTGVEGKASTIDIRYSRPCGCASGTVEFSASTGLNPNSLTLTVVRPPTSTSTSTTSASGVAPAIASPTATSAPAALTAPAAVVGSLAESASASGLGSIDLRDTERLPEAERVVQSTLTMVGQARSVIADLIERVSSAIDRSSEVTVGNASLSALRYESAARALEGVQRFRELMARDWGLGLVSQANSNQADALKALDGA